MTPKSLEERIQRLEDVNEIKNIMGRYCYYHMAGEDELKYALFANKADTRVYFGEQGYWEGSDAPQRAWGGFAKSIGTDRNQPRVGSMALHAPIASVVEVAGDGKTAKGVWVGWGFLAMKNRETGEPEASWELDKYGIDFIKEDGQWKIWHHHIYSLLHQCGWDEKWAEQFSKPEPFFPGLKTDGPAVDNNPYRPDTVQRLVPKPPDPYETFDPKDMY